MLVKPFIGDYSLNKNNLFGANPQYYKQFLVKHPDGTRKPLAGHNGIDWLTPSGTIVVSPINGKVIEVSFDDNGYGNYIKIENEQCGVILAHLEKVEVSVGFTVTQGQRIAISDNTGYSTGSHIHEGFYTMPRNRSDGFGGFVNPVPYHTDINQETLEVYENANLSIGGANLEERPAEESKLYTKVEYDTCMKDRNDFWEERDEARKKLKLKTEEFDKLNSIYTEIKALGYKNADDIQKALDEKTEQVTSLQTQIAQVSRRNTVILEELKKKDEEDATAIEMGIEASKKVKELQNDMREVHRAVNVDPEAGLKGMARLLSTIKNLQVDARKVSNQIKKEAEVTDEQVESVSKKYNFDWLLKLFGLMSITIATATTTVFVSTLIIL